MPAKTPADLATHVTVVLGGHDYRVLRLTLGQQRRLLALTQERQDRLKVAVPAAEAGEDAAAQSQETVDAMLRHGFAVAAILLERAEPSVGDIEDLACSLDELREASAKIQSFTGMVKDANQGKPTAKPAN
jgi:hypothetical protein